MSAIVSKDYAVAEEILFNDRIVRDMAVGLRGVPIEALTHGDGETPHFNFMASANAEYAKRGGQNQAHMGAVANALLRLKREGIDSLTERS